MKVVRSNVVLKPNNARVLFRPFALDNPQRVLKIIARVMELSDAEVKTLMDGVLEEFRGRHQKPKQFFLQRFEAVREHLLTDRPVDNVRQLLIGAYFTQEYSLESAALFNPSLVWHPDQSGVPEGSKRFVCSLRATGEGHISSITFRSGIVDDHGEIHLDQATRFVTAPEVVPNAEYEKGLFQRKLRELGMVDKLADNVLTTLPDPFTLPQLQDAVSLAARQQGRIYATDPTVKGMLALAKANYEIQYDASHNLSERIIFPYSPTETNGIEDARWVRFEEEDGSVRYYATYTAYDGRLTFPQLVQTTDFLRFRISTLNGPEVRNKGMALFPRKIKGMYAVLSRQDGENLFLMYSDNLNFWYTKETLLKPTYSWEFVQIGNCGSPIETDAGWLVLSHGVGPMRKYALGAFLLDKENPSKVIGRLEEPLLTANDNEREGYVPNVVYSCGGLVHNGHLILPYAMSDYASTFATVSLSELLGKLRPEMASVA